MTQPQQPRPLPKDSSPFIQDLRGLIDSEKLRGLADKGFAPIKHGDGGGLWGTSGVQNDDVAVMQRLITECGEEDLPDFNIDGIYRNETEAAVTSYKAKKGITEEGAGEQVLSELQQDCQRGLAKKKEDEEKEAENEANITKKINISDQCFLLEKFDELLSKPINKKGANKVAREEVEYNRVMMAEGDPSTFLNKMKMNSNIFHFLRAKNHELSEVVPTIRIFKEFYVDEDGEPVELEMKFPTYVDPTNDLDAMLQNR